MGRRKPLQLVMNGGKPKFRYVLFNENRVFVEASLLFFMCDSVSMKEKLIVYLGILIKKIDNHEIEQCVLITKILDL